MRADHPLSTENASKPICAEMEYSLGKLFGVMNKEVKEQVQCYYIRGYSTCYYFKRAKCVAEKLKSHYPNDVKVFIEEVPKQDWGKLLSHTREELRNVTAAQQHRTSPIVFEKNSNNISFIGGSDDFVQLVSKRYGFTTKECS